MQTTWIAPAIAIAVAITAAGPAMAETDTLTVEHPGIVVEALRGRDPLSRVPAAAFVLTGDDVRRSGVGRLTSLLATLPGMHGYRRNAYGDAAVVDARGFSASGESSYLKLLVDGRDVRDVENGNLDWDWVSPQTVERVEVVQGPGAWLYGNSAEGGVVNIVEREPAAGLGSDCVLRTGSFGFAEAGFALRAARAPADGAGREALRGRAGWREVTGWRQRSRERVGSGALDLRARRGPWRVTFDVRGLDADRQDPGTLSAAQMAADRDQSETPWDYGHARTLLAGARLARGGGAAEWSLSPWMRAEDSERLQTLFFMPMLHETHAWTTGADLTWRQSVRSVMPVMLLAGAEASHSTLRSTYDDFTPGAGFGARAGDGFSRRTLLAGYAGATVALDPVTTVRAQVRGDAARVRSRDDLSATSVDTRTLSAVSPMLALHRTIGAGSVWTSVSGAFRVPTLLQLYDRRPFQTFSGLITLSNDALDPQRSVNVEVGGRIDGSAGAFASVTAYSARVRDEIDFDLQAFRYSNISRSWHRGIQAAVHQPFGGRARAVASATWQPTTFSGGDSDGFQINGVPEALGSVALGFDPLAGATVELLANLTGRQFLDKQERNSLAGGVTFDLVVSAGFGRVRGVARVQNLSGRRYADTGFIGFDAGFQPEERFSPAAPRGVQVSLRFD